MVFGRRVLFLLIVFKANLNASSSAPDGPLSMDSNIPPVEDKNMILVTVQGDVHSGPVTIFNKCSFLLHKYCN